MIPSKGVFYLITPTGVAKAWDTGDPYMLEYVTVSNDCLGTGVRGRINKRLLSHLLLSDKGYDLVSEAGIFGISKQ